MPFIQIRKYIPKSGKHKVFNIPSKTMLDGEEILAFINKTLKMNVP